MDLPRELQGAALFALSVGLVFLSAELLHRLRGVSPEKTRKITHAGSGLVILTLPALVSSHWTVMALAGGFGAILLLTRRMGWLPSVHAVRRRSRGAEYYPLSVWLMFFLADGEAIRFLVPILVLALCDPVAALVGQEVGRLRYRVEADAYRTLEGSATFFALCYLLVLVTLGLTGAPTPSLAALLLIPLVVAAVATGVEAISWGGLDNLLVPYAVAVVLEATWNRDPHALRTWVLAMALMTSLGAVSFQRARLTTTGFVSLFLTGTLCWALGGWPWLAPLLVVHLVFLASRGHGQRRIVDSRELLAVAAIGLGCLALWHHWGWDEAYGLFLLSIAAHSSIAWWTHAERRALLASFGAARAGDPQPTRARSAPGPGERAGARLHRSSFLPAGLSTRWGLLPLAAGAGALLPWGCALLPSSAPRLSPAWLLSLLGLALGAAPLYAWLRWRVPGGALRARQLAVLLVLGGAAIGGVFL